jgi:spermidine synthase
MYGKRGVPNFLYVPNKNHSIKEIIGMGPAALGRFLHHYFPNMEVDHVEIDQDLVTQVNSTLPLPISPNFQVYPQS